MEVLEGEDLFFCVGVGFEDVAAVDAGEDSAGERWGEEFAAFAEEDVADCAFGEFVAFVEEDYVVVALGDGFFVEAVVEGAAGGFVVEEEVGGGGGFCGEADEAGGLCGECGCGDGGCSCGVEQEADAVFCVWLEGGG